MESRIRFRTLCAFGCAADDAGCAEEPEHPAVRPMSNQELWRVLLLIRPAALSCSFCPGFLAHNEERHNPAVRL
jgi:hypothetical protein